MRSSAVDQGWEKYRCVRPQRCILELCGRKVLIIGFGRSGHAVGDIPGVRFKVAKVAGVSLWALYKDKKENPRS
jgi:ribosomal protein S12